MMRAALFDITLMTLMPPIRCFIYIIAAIDITPPLMPPRYAFDIVLFSAPCHSQLPRH